MLIHTIYIRLAAAALAVFLSSGLSLADTATPENPSPWVYWINADSADISFSQMTARLKTLDVSDPEQILSFSGTTLWTGTIDIKVVDTIMFALNVNGLQILDISNITSPVLIRQVHLGLGGYYNFMFVDGSELYVGRNDRVLILDISNPVDPQELSVIHLQGMVHEMLVQDNRAYFGIARYSNETNTDSPALYICDVTDPTTPSIVGKYESPLPHKDARRFVVVGDYIYSINHFDRFLDVISIVDETNPIRVNTLSLSYLYDIACYQGYLYVYSGTEIKVYDITSPELPVLQSTYNAEGSGIYLEIHNDKLYAMKYYDPVFTVFDLSTPTELDSIGYHVARGRWYSATLHGDHLYIPEGSWGLTIADISNPYDIERIGEFSNDCSTLMGIDAKGDYAYLTNYMSYFSGDSSQRRNGIYVIDATDKQNPEFVKWVSIAGNTSDAFIHDSLLIISQCPRTHIFSLADPLNPVYIQRYPVQDYIYSHSTTARGTVMYICGSGYGFELASIADPSNPYPLANVKAPSVDSRATITALLRGNRAYVADRVMGSQSDELRLMTVDISNPSDPSILNDLLIAEYDWWVSAGYQMTVVGDYMYYAGGYHGLNIIDLSNPDQPDVIDRIMPDVEYFGEVVFKRKYIFASGNNSIYVFDIADRENPQLVQYVPLTSSVGKMDIDGDYLHVACATGYYLFFIDLPPVDCGDCDASGAIDIDDVVWLISYIFSGGLPPDPLSAGDVDCSGGVDIDDVVYLITYIFAGGSPPCDGCP